MTAHTCPLCHSRTRSFSRNGDDGALAAAANKGAAAGLRAKAAGKTLRFVDASKLAAGLYASKSERDEFAHGYVGDSEYLSASMRTRLMGISDHEKAQRGSARSSSRGSSSSGSSRGRSSAGSSVLAAAEAAGRKTGASLSARDAMEAHGGTEEARFFQPAYNRYSGTPGAFRAWEKGFRAGAGEAFRKSRSSSGSRRR